MNETPSELSDNGFSQSSESSMKELSLAWKIFNAFIEMSDFSATEDELMHYAVTDLKTDLSELPPVFIEQLPLILVTFMNTWSGWLYKSEFLAGKINKEHYFIRFHKYMAHKIRALHNNAFIKSTLKDLPLEFCDYKFKCPNETTSGSAVIKKNPEFFPYAVSIQCPPHILNTIVFSNLGDDVIMKQHLGSSWNELSTAQLVNWPHIQVSFYTQDISFVRSQATDYVRYLNFLPHECKKNNERIIEDIKTFGKSRACYTYRFLEEYIKEYILSLKTVTDITGWKLEEIQTILSQFLEDVKHININDSMATNTVVLFRLSQVPFIRNKKLVKNPDAEDDARVGYCEIITPKVELLLLHFKPQQNNTPYISFKYTDSIKRSPATNDPTTILPLITYKCTYCKVEFKTGNTKKQIMDHLKKDHKMEQHVRCTVCKKQFDVLNLAACRWRHKCIFPSSSVTVM